jgi:hypothetical protein
MNANATPRPKAVVQFDGGGWVVWTEWPGVEVPRTMGIKTADEGLAYRLADLIRAGKVFVNPEIKTDVNGKTYIWATPTIDAKNLAAEVLRLEKLWALS